MCRFCNHGKHGDQSLNGNTANRGHRVAMVITATTHTGSLSDKYCRNTFSKPSIHGHSKYMKQGLKITNAVHSHYQGILYCQHVTQFDGTRLSVSPLTPTPNAGISHRRFSRHPQMPNSVTCRRSPTPPVKRGWHWAVLQYTHACSRNCKEI
jgi:hypothetical protein